MRASSVRAATATRPGRLLWPQPWQPLQPAAPRYVCRQCITTSIASSSSPLSPLPVDGRRGIKISVAPATEYPPSSGSDAFGATGAESVRDEADARFEVLGSPYSLLTVNLSASQKLYTRRGTLVSVAGKLENTQSTLAVLAPVRRGLLGLPFLYQRITSTSPVTLLIGTRATSTTLFTLRLDGTTDWVVAQRNALLAWTGHTLSVSPQRQKYGGSGNNLLGLGIAHWGSTFLTGRGLAALAAPGCIYPVTLAAGEELAVHPSHVVAYAVSRHAPQPYRLREGGAAAATKAAAETAAAVTKSASSAAGRLAGRLHLQVPAVPALSSLPASLARFFRAMRETTVFEYLARSLFAVRTLLRETIWGDRLLVRVQGPTTLLLSSRGVRVADVLSRDEVNEIADTEAGVVAAAVDRAAGAETKIDVTADRPSATVELSEAKELKEFVR